MPCFFPNIVMTFGEELYGNAWHLVAEEEEKVVGVTVAKERQWRGAKKWLRH